ncbi:MAG: S8 family serine peptidase [Betaproteobacteria bacterium]
MGDPVLLSVVHFTSETTSVALDANERIAYVGLGARGVALVDLDGPASVQPIDLDHDGVDDRILGVIDTPGSAGRLALALDRGLAFVADASAGLTAIQLLPPRTSFTSLERDPIAGRTGDEQSILTSGVAFTSDQAIEVSVNVAASSRDRLVLRIDERPDPTGTPRLSFADGALSTPLEPGLNAFSMPIEPAAAAGGSTVALVVQTVAGATVARQTFRLAPFDASTAAIRSLVVAPDAVSLDLNQQFAQLSIAGVLDDGTTINLTGEPATRFAISSDAVATVNASGLVLANAGGHAIVTVTHGGLAAEVPVSVDLLAAVVGFETTEPFVTLTSAGDRKPLSIDVKLSDGGLEPFSSGLGTFETSNPSVATVDAAGNVVAVGEGTALITVRSGNAVAEVHVAVEFRTPPVVSSIALAAPATVPSDSGQATLSARVTGTGSLEGLAVTFALQGQTGASSTAQTDYDGIAAGILRGLHAPGTFTVQASVVNPADGTTLSAAATVTVERAGGDIEPNDTVAGAIPLAPDTPVSGNLGPGDLVDVYATTSSTPGTLTAALTLPVDADPASLRVVFLAADGSELARTTPSSHRQNFRQDVAAGSAFVAVESTGPSAAYQLETRMLQGPIGIASVSPLSGGPGTPVAIVGTGFSLDPTETRVLFNGALAKVVSATPTRIDAVVPANAIDGPVRVVSAAMAADGPVFTAGATSRPPITLASTRSENLRFDPVAHLLVDATRLLIFADPVVDRTQIEALVGGLGGTIIGATPALNAYYVEFAANQTIAGLAAIRRQLAQSPLVLHVLRDTFATPAGQAIDLRDKAGVWPGTDLPRALAFDLSKIFEAVDLIRSTRPFTDSTKLAPVHVGVIDTGFMPFKASEFQAQGQTVVTLFRSAANVGPFSSGNLGLIDPVGHGTEVTGIIAATNDGVGASGALNDLFRPGEAPFQVLVYGVADPLSGRLSSAQIFAALAALAARGDVDAVNMSFETKYTGQTPEFTDDSQAFLDAFALFGGRTALVAAAGNDGVDAQFVVPAALSKRTAAVITVGAVAVANLDGSGEGADARAIFNDTGGDVENGDVPCRAGTATLESNCGSVVTLAAAGEDIFTTSTFAPGYLDGAVAAGTSFAAPIVTAIVGMLQAIRTAGAQPLTAAFIRDLLVSSADDISATWGAGPMRRLDALNAVRAVLPPSGTQMIYVADQDAVNDNGLPPGRIIGIDVDPKTGQPILPPNHKVIPLTFTKNGITFTGARPTALAISPSGEKFYAVVRSVAPDLGDGVLVVNTLSNEAEDFIPFSGVAFAAPAGGAPPGSGAPVLLSNLRPGMVFSKDGRLLYVAVGTGIAIVNTTEEKLVRSFADLPAAFKTLAAGQLPDLAWRQSAVAVAVAAGINTTQGHRPGVAINGLTLSPDGRTLFAVVSTGGGGGTQPGGVIPIDVDLYKDARPDVAGLQSDLSGYFTPIGTTGVVPMSSAGDTAGGDEPGAAAVSGNGKHLYLVNGGLDFFEAIPPADLDLAKYGILLAGPAAISFGGSGLAGLLATIGGFGSLESSLYAQLLADIKAQASSGVTFIGAPGFSGVFDLQPGTAQAPPSLTQSWLFPSEVSFGWNPNVAGQALVVNQFHIKGVFARRPFDIAMRPDGRRAVVPFFQTGNVGILDLERQAQFLSPPGATPKPAFSGVAPDLFQGVVAVTPALALDNQLWPQRGAFKIAGTPNYVPSPDESLLFTWDAEYAQNGRFSVASHAGNGDPRTVTAPIPDFVTNTDNRFRLTELGATFNGNSVSWVEHGQTISGSIGDTVSLQRGGGAISITSDAAIDADFNAHIGSTTVDQDNQVRPYYSGLPVAGAVTNLDVYTPGTATPVAFHRPRGIAIQPFVGIEVPRFGDHVTAHEPVGVVWRDARVQRVRFELGDPDAQDSFGQAATLNTFSEVLSDEAARERAFDLTFGALFAPGTQAAQGKRYRITAEILDGSSDEISRTSIDVTFDDAQKPIDTTTNADKLQLTPRLNFFVTAPTSGPGKPLKLVLIPADGGPPQDVTAQATFQTIDHGLLKTDIPGFGTMEDAIFSKLEANGVTVPFRIADVAVDNGSLKAISGGVQAVEGCITVGAQTKCSNPVIVIAGVELDSIDLSPESLLTGALQGATAAANLAKNNLTKKIKDVEINPPMILAADDNAVALDKGVVSLDNVQFQFFGGPWKLGLKDLYDAVGNVLTDLGPETAPEQIVLKLVEVGVGQCAAGLLDYAPEDAAVAAMSPTGIPCVENVVQAGAPGLTHITGTLDLTSLDLGKKSDDVTVFVLPSLESAQIEPATTVIPDLATKASIRTFARMKLAQAAHFHMPDKYRTFTEFVDKVLPGKWKTIGTNGIDYTFDGGYRVSFKFQLSLDDAGKKIDFSDVEIGFHTPNVFNSYDVGQPVTAVGSGSGADHDSIARVSSPGSFEATEKVEAVGAAGTTFVGNKVSMPLMGDARATGKIVVCSDPAGCEQPQLTPRIVFSQVGANCSRQLRVQAVAADGTARDVTGDPDTQYFSLQGEIDKGTITVAGVSIPALQTAVDAAVNAIKQKLSANGITVPFAHGRVSISPTGALTVNAPGLELVWATYKGKFASFSVVLAGLKLGKLSLEPLSLATAPLQTDPGEALFEKVAKAVGADGDPPMILVNSDPGVPFSFLNRQGLVRLHDLTFNVLGASIGVRDLIGALKDFIAPEVAAVAKEENDPNPQDPAPPTLLTAMFKLAEFSVEEAAAQLLDFEVDDGKDVVDLTAELPKGVVTAKKPGVATIKASLALGDDACGLGKATGEMMVWVLPGLQSLALEPPHVVMCANTADPGATIRSIVCSQPLPPATLQLPSEFTTVGEFADHVLPQSLQPPIPGQANIDHTFRDGDFELRVRATVTVNFSDITLSNLQICFTVPNGLDGAPGVPPFITNAYNFDDPSVAFLNGASAFSAFVKDLGQPGETEIDNTVEVATIASLAAAGTVTVVNCPPGSPVIVVDKALDATGPGVVAGPNGPVVSPGATVHYIVRVGNVGTQEIDNLQVSEAATLTDANGAPLPDQPQIVSCTTASAPQQSSCFVPALQPNEFVEFDVLVSVPQTATGAVLTNTASAGGSTAQVSTPTASPTITVTKLLIDPGPSGAPDSTIDPTGAPVLKPGEQVRYRIEVRNVGTADEQNIALSDLTTQVNASAQPTTLFQKQYPPFNLAAGTSTQFEETVTLPADCGSGQTIRNVATTAGNLATVTNLLRCSPQLSIVKTLVDPPVADGVAIAGTTGPLQQVRYRIEVSNSGTAEASNVTVTDDPRLEKSGQPPISLAPPGTVPGCALGTIPPGGSAQCELVFAFGTEANGTNLVNTATVAAPAGGPSATTTNPVIAPTLVIKKEIIAPAPDPQTGHSTVLAGTTITYRVRVTNKGIAAATNVVLNDQPFISDVSGQVTPLTNSLFTFPAIDPNQTIEEPVAVAVPLGFGGGELLNHAEITNVPGVNPVEVVSDVVQPQLVVEKHLVDPPGDLSRVVRGSTVTYAVTVTNTGTAIAPGVAGTDTASIDGRIFAGPSPLAFGDIAAGQSVTKTVVLRVPTLGAIVQPCPPGIPCSVTTPRMTNIAEIPGTAAVTTNDVVNPKLRVTEALVDPPPVANQPTAVPGGSVATYSITVENTDTIAAEAVLLADKARVGAVTLFDRTFQLGTLQPGDRRVQLVRVEVPVGFDGASLVNDATVDYLQEAAATTSNTIADPTVVLDRQLLDGPGVIDVAGQPPIVVSGSTVSYEVTARNIGTTTLSGITLTDAPSVQVRAADGTATETALPVATAAIATLLPGQTFTTTIAVAVPPSGSGGFLLNRLTANVPGSGTLTTEDGIVDPGPAGPIVTEMVLAPRQDWSDSAGGNNRPFDSTPGNGLVDAGDLWIEVLNPTTATQNWQVRITDATGATFSKTLGPPDASSTVRLLTGFGAVTLPVASVDVLDDQGVVQKHFDVAAMERQLGRATGPDDESLAWSVLGLPSPDTQQFVRGRATIGVFSPF